MWRWREERPANAPKEDQLLALFRSLHALLIVEDLVLDKLVLDPPDLGRVR